MRSLLTRTHTTNTREISHHAHPRQSAPLPPPQFSSSKLGAAPPLEWCSELPALMKYKSINKPELFGLMRTLKLTGLKITSLDPGALMLTGLRSLDVSSNELSRVTNLCDGLVSLAAHNNEIEEFDIPPSPSLMQLGLGFNKIERVAPADCDNLNSLVSLDLSYNKVRVVCV